LSSRLKSFWSSIQRWFTLNLKSTYCDEANLSTSLLFGK
jgi:hypothetical protein